MDIMKILGTIGAILANPQVLDLAAKVLTAMTACQVCAKPAANNSAGLCLSCLDAASTAARAAQAQDTIKRANTI